MAVLRTGVSAAFLGKGLHSPLREDVITGDFQGVREETNVNQCLRDGILTAIGERVMAEPVGTIAHNLIFEESEVVADLLEPSVRDFIERFEPRIILQSITVALQDMSASLSSFICKVVYVVRATNTRQNLTFPFYLQSRDAGGA